MFIIISKMSAKCFCLEDSVGTTKIPFFFVGDNAFPLCKRIMVPYSSSKKKPLSEEEIIFDYRLSRARRIVENSFSLLTNKWQCIRREMFCAPDRVKKIVSACCVLHNLMIGEQQKSNCPKSYDDYYVENDQFVEG